MKRSLCSAELPARDSTNPNAAQPGRRLAMTVDDWPHPGPLVEVVLPVQPAQSMTVDDLSLIHI